MEKTRKMSTVSGTQKEEMTRTLVLATVISSFGSIQYGYNFWVVNHPLGLVQGTASLNKTQQGEDYNFSEFLVFLLGLTVFIFPLGGLVGSLLVGPLVDICGRKDTLLINNFLSIISAVLMGSSSVITDYEFLLFSRLFCGICAGIFSCAVPLYVGEISPQDLRGAAIVVSLLFVDIGALLAHILGHPQILGTKKDWPVMLSLMGIPAIVAIFLLPFVPESPRYLLLQKSNKEKAMAALKKLRGQDNVEDEMQDLYQEDMAERGEKNMNVLKLLRFRALRWQVLSIVILMVCQQLSGIHMAHVYMEKVDEAALLQNYKIEFTSMASILIGLLSLVLSSHIIDSVGRRILLLTGYGITNIFSVLLTMSFELEGTIPWMFYISCIFVVIFIFGHAFGPGSIPTVLMVELFLQSSRSSAFVIGGFVQWLLNFIMEVLESHMMNWGAYTFLLFWPVCTVAFVYSFKMIPETQQKSFLTIKKLMALHMAKKIMVKGSPNKGDFRRRSSRASRRSTKWRSSLRP